MIPQAEVLSYPIYLTELARRAVAHTRPIPNLTVDEKAFRECQTARLDDPQSMVRLLKEHTDFAATLAEYFQLPPDDLGRLARRAIDKDIPENLLSKSIRADFFECKCDLNPMVCLLESDPRLQQQLAYALDYVPSRWLLEAEIPVVVDSRRQRKLNAPDLNRTLEALRKDQEDRQKYDDHLDAYDWARCNQLTGLCLSGGGIRSATFNLGVLQGLAALDLLREFDYISSVSGGGYIHEWLAGWIKREDLRIAETNAALALKRASDPTTAPDPETAWGPQNGFDSVNRLLRPLPEGEMEPDPTASNGTPKPNPNPGDGDRSYTDKNPWHSPRSFTPEPIRWLRRYSNYLTPETGFFSADTWVVIAIWVRNTLLNQIILVSLLFALVLVPYLVGESLAKRHTWFLYHLHTGVSLPLAILLFLAATAVFCIGLRQELQRVRHADIYEADTAPQEPALIGDGFVLWGIVAELLGAAVLLTRVLVLPSPPPLLYFTIYLLIAFQLSAMALAGGILRGYRLNHGFPTPKLPKDASFFARTSAVFTRSINHSHSRIAVFSRVVFAPLLSGAVLNSLVAALGAVVLLAVLASLLRFTGCDALHFSNLPHAAWLSAHREDMHLPLGGLSLPSVKPSTFRMHSWPGAEESLLTPRVRVQLAFGPPSFLLAFFLGMVLMAGLVGRNFPDWLREWIARVRALCILISVGWIAFFGLALLGPAFVQWIAHYAPIKWTAVLTWVATTAGSVLAGKTKKSAGTSEDTSVWLNYLAEIGPYVFILGLIILLSWGANSTYENLHEARWILVTLLLAVFALFGWRVDINEFSMNPFYRNRLTRCFLGASNPRRDPSPLTGLDDRDTRGLQIAKLQPSNNPRENYSGPLPIINTTLNISFGEDLAYQERKAASFFFSPLFSGYTVGWTSGKRGKGLHFNGFVPTSQFYCPEGGINIATAAAISGAAASPNAGFHTNPATAFLMTLFNVRLGWWIANPRRSPNAGYLPTNAHTPVKWPSPRFSPIQLASELLGRTDDSSAYVYLSDGGHFDNMGLYELVRRRCYRIVICDAESDENYTFEGLGMAIRKCRIDFGVEILLSGLSRLRKDIKSGNCKSHFVLGTIRYPETPKDKTEDKKYLTGTIIYLKSSLTGDAKWLPDPPPAKDTEPTKLDAESADILNYKLQHKSFPHDTTANQWFTESQFESYRRLGQHVVEEAYCCHGWAAFGKVPAQPNPPASVPDPTKANTPPPADAPDTAQDPHPMVTQNGATSHSNGQPLQKARKVGFFARFGRFSE